MGGAGDCLQFIEKAGAAMLRHSLLGIAAMTWYTAYRVQQKMLGTHATGYQG